MNMNDLILDANSPENMAELVAGSALVFRQWLMDRLEQADDEAFNLTFDLAWCIRDRTYSPGKHLHQLLLRDCQEMIGEYLAEIEAMEEIEDVCV
jgi:hypothetical protein